MEFGNKEKKYTVLFEKTNFTRSMKISAKNTQAAVDMVRNKFSEANVYMVTKDGKQCWDWK